jgi:hypothetical protein
MRRYSTPRTRRLRHADAPLPDDKRPGGAARQPSVIDLMERYVAQYFWRRITGDETKSVRRRSWHLMSAPDSEYVSPTAIGAARLAPATARSPRCPGAGVTERIASSPEPSCSGWSAEGSRGSRRCVERCSEPAFGEKSYSISGPERLSGTSHVASPLAVSNHERSLQQTSDEMGTWACVWKCACTPIVRLRAGAG